MTKEFHKSIVLDIPYLEIKQGEIYGVVGPSGAGKSTLLRLLNLLEQPTRGNIYYRGSPLTDHNTALLTVRRQMTMVFQRPILFNDSVLNNVIYGLTARGSDRGVAHQLAAEALEKVGLAGFANRNARALSGGEAQRVALARAMVLQPKVLLLDEPTSNLDPANVRIIEEITRELNRNLNTTVIMVTHNIFQARRLATNVLYLYKGELVEAGDVEQVFTAPKDKRTQAFISGDMIY